ncbi:ribosome biogenesis ATPase RIX7 [Akanthomyces lecanii RCEF 1005]|uniref:Ribosome biogenesis ATPase RIX7 n=1 Tax=Akanthomyces lecanii RCEF 1005 TaxID=1081108 RepID=A0A167ZMW4_CORDF|nr:ribosome biogenesis ATPase RIX7 [Akanthomyces lecanii RCEF 1005]
MPSLSSRLDHDVYQVVRRLEESSNDCKPFKTVSAAYSAIKTSNSSLSRQKKRPLEDALFRVLDVRKREQVQDESDDSEAEIDVDFETPETKGDERFLLNRQITKHWKVEPASMSQATSNGEQPAKKKRRVETEADEGNTIRATSEGAKEPKEAKTADGSKLQKKTPRGPLFDVETDIELRLGGLGATYEAILTKTRHALFADEHYEDPTKIGRHIHGLALTGPSFVGKKSYIRAIASHLNVPLINITRCFREQERVEKSLTEAFDTAVAAAPCIVYIKHIEQIMPKSGEASQNEQHQKAFDALQRQMERLAAQRTPVMCMVTATRQDDAYPALFGPDMIEKDYQLRVPNVKERHDILSHILHDNTVHNEVDLLDVARRMDGCVGGDIVMLAEGATTNAGLRLAAAKDVDLGRPSSDDQDPDTEGTRSILQPNPITLEDFNVALADYTPTLRKEGFTAIPNVTWDQVGGLASVRAQLRLSIVGPITQPELYAKFGLARAGGCLLWGPPGCGKTLIAQAVANEAQASFILINGPELLNKYVGESERAVRELFTRARSSTPCILFFDEFDSIASRRDSGGSQSGGGAGTRVVNALLTELDGARGRDGIYVIGTTNRPDMIDEAILRPGRLSKQLFLDLPTEAERVEILRTIYRNRHVGASDEELARLDDVARDARCGNFSGADLSGLHERAAEIALTRFLDKGHVEATGEIKIQDWEEALKVTKPSVAKPESFRKLMRAKQ